MTPCPKCGVQMGYTQHDQLCPAEVIDVVAYPEEMYHLHGKALSGDRHSHPLRPDEDVDHPEHTHELSRSEGRVIYWYPVGWEPPDA